MKIRRRLGKRHTRTSMTQVLRTKRGDLNFVGAVRVTVTGLSLVGLVALVTSTKERCGRVLRVFENRRFAYRSIEFIAVTGKARLSFLVNSYARTSLAEW